MDGLPSPGGFPGFPNPEKQQQQPPQPPCAPGTTMAAAASSLSAAGKKRPASSPATESPGRGLLGRAIDAMTPLRWKRSRSSLEAMSGSAIRSVNRTSLGSDEGIGERMAQRGYASDGVKSGERRLEKLNLEIKFEAPSAEVNANGGGNDQSVQQALALGCQQQRAVVRQASATLTAGTRNTNAMERPSAKRLCIGSSGTGRAAGDRSSAGGAASAKKVRIGATTSFASPPATNAVYGVIADDGTSTPAPAARGTPKFKVRGAATLSKGVPNINFSSMASPTLRDIRGRRATPGGKFLLGHRFAPGANMSTRSDLSASGAAGGGSTTGPAPGAARGSVSGGARGGMDQEAAGGLTRTRQVTIYTVRNFSAASLSSASTAKTSNTAASKHRARGAIRSRATLSRSTGYRRRRIDARKFRPISRLLTGLYTQPDDGQKANGMVGNKGGQSVLLTESIVAQILQDGRSKLGLADRDRDQTLFGGDTARSGDEVIDGARTFEEEAARYTAVNKRLPRVRMNRLLGTGQTGGRRYEMPGALQPAAAVPMVAPVSTMVAANSVIASAPAAPLFGGAMAAAKPLPAAGATPMPPKAVAFESAMVLAGAKSDTEIEHTDKAAIAESYTAATLQPRGNDGLRLTPCKSSQESLSKEEGLEIERRVGTEEWRIEAMGARLGFDDPSVNTPRKASPRARRRGTPHPKITREDDGLLKEADEITARQTASATPGPGAPYSFMPGGPAATSKLPAPLAFKFGAPSALDAARSSKSPKVGSGSTPASVAKSPTPAPAVSGWGTLFKSKPGEWKCDSCYVRNPADAADCLSCGAPKPDSAGSSSAPGGGTSGDGAMSNGSKLGKAGIGAGGFTFTGSTASVTASSGLSPAAKPFTPTTAAVSPNLSPAAVGGQTFDLNERKEGEGEKKAGGVTFGATPAKSKRSHEDGDGSKTGISAGGFSFGGATVAPTSMSMAAPLSGVNAGGLIVGAIKTLANTPAKPKRGRDGEEDSSGQVLAPVGGFLFGATAAAAGPSTASKAPSSSDTKFCFGGVTAPVDENKVGPDGVGMGAACMGGFNFSAAPTPPAETKGGASMPGVSFSALPATEKEKATELSSKRKAIFKFGDADVAPSFSTPAGNGATPAAAPGTGFSFDVQSGGVAGTGKKDETRTTLFAFGAGRTPAPAKPANGVATSTTPPVQHGAQPAKKDGAVSTSKPAFLFGAEAEATPKKPADGAATLPPTPFPFGASSATPAAAAKKNEATSTGKTTFKFGTTTVPPPAGSNTATPTATTAPFTFGAPSSQVPAPSGTFAFGAGVATSTPAPSRLPPPPVSSFAYGAGAATAPPAAPPPASGFGAVPAPVAGGGFGEFGNASSASQPMLTTPTATTPGPTTFSFGTSSTTAAPSAGGFGASGPTTGGFGSFGAQPAAALAPSGTFAFGGTNLAAPPVPGYPLATPAPASAFRGGSAFGGGATSGAAGGGGGFSIGTGGGSKKTPSGRRILKARRPPGSNSR